MCYAEWLNSFRRCGWRHRAYFLTGINLNYFASVSVRRDIMECFIFVLKPDWSLYSQGGFFTWFPAHKAYCALLPSICSRSLSDISGCMYGRAGNHTVWWQAVKHIKSDVNSGRVFLLDVYVWFFSYKMRNLRNAQGWRTAWHYLQPPVGWCDVAKKQKRKEKQLCLLPALVT